MVLSARFLIEPERGAASMNRMSWTSPWILRCRFPRFGCALWARMENRTARSWWAAIVLNSGGFSCLSKFGIDPARPMLASLSTCEAVTHANGIIAVRQASTTTALRNRYEFVSCHRVAVVTVVVSVARTSARHEGAPSCSYRPAENT